MDIAELVKKAKQKDAAAFAEIYDLFADRIFRYIRLKVRENEQAEDILQDVFVKAWQGLHTVALEDLNFKAWLYKVAGNTINDHFRHIYRLPQIAALDEAMHVSDASSPDKDLKIQQDKQAIRESLEALPVQYKQVLELRFIQDFTLQETADILRKSNLAVRLLQHRALKQLKIVITKDVYEY